MTGWFFAVLRTAGKKIAFGPDNRVTFRQKLVDIFLHPVEFCSSFSVMIDPSNNGCDAGDIGDIV